MDAEVQFGRIPFLLSFPRVRCASWPEWTRPAEQRLFDLDTCAARSLRPHWRDSHHADRGRPLTIGRSHGNSLSLSSAEISRLHAEIVKNKNHYILRDLGSRAGTFVNDETVIEKTLEHDDRIRLGQHSDLRFLLKDTSETAARATDSAVGDLRQTVTLLTALGTAKMLD